MTRANAASCIEAILFTVLVCVFAYLAQGCAAMDKVVDYGCKAACGICNTACPLVRDAMEDVGDEEEAPVPEPPAEDAGPVALRPWDGM